MTEARRSIEAELQALASPVEHAKVSRRVGAEQTIGVRMGSVFDLAKRHRGLTLPEIVEVLQSPWYEARMVAVSVLDLHARRPLSVDGRRELAHLYLAEHDRINTWDLVDRCAPRVLGGWLQVEPAAVGILDELAASADPWRRRSATVATYSMARAGESRIVLRVAERLLGDIDLVQSAVGVALRHLGTQNPEALATFMAQHGDRVDASMRRTLRT